MITVKLPEWVDVGFKILMEMIPEHMFLTDAGLVSLKGAAWLLLKYPVDFCQFL